MTTVLKHPLASSLLAKLRDKKTSHSEYRNLCKSLTTIVGIYASQNLSVHEISVNTPICEALCQVISKDLILIPILRAGLGMLEPMQNLFPDAKTGFIGLARDTTGTKPEQYYLNIPNETTATIMLLDPMIATGHSALKAIEYLHQIGFTDIKLLSFLAAPEGLARIEALYPKVQIYTTCIDQELNYKKYIVPGLGDFGDRLFGTAV